MSTIVTRAGKGSALTYAEVDSNFTNLNTDKYQSGSAASLASLTLSSALPVLSGGTGVTSSTGSGSVALSTSPTLVTPLLGTPTSGNFSTGTFTWPTFNQNTTGSAGSVANAVTFNSGGAGDASGTGFNGAAARTISYNTLGASPLAGSSSLITTGTITSGTWNATPIGNSYLANSLLTIGTTSISLGATSLTLGGLTSVAVTQDPVSALQLATKQYVDAVAQNLNIHAACAAATPNTLASITGGTVTYNNGTAGVGATLTLSVALTVLDGYTLQNGNRVLVKNEAAQANNGIYTWATGGTVLTRATDFDTTTEITSGDFTFITNGTLYANAGWVQTNITTVIGTSPIVFVQFSGAGTYTAGTGLTLTGSQFSLTSPVLASLGGTGQTSYAVGDLLYASGATALSKLADVATGNALISGGVGLAPSYGKIGLTTHVSGILPVANGGTNVSVAGIAAFNNITGYTAAGATGTTSTNLVFSTSPTLVTPILGTPQSGDFSTGTFTWPTFNQSTTGSAAKWTTARTLAGNSVDGSANVAFANKFILQGTADTGLSGAQFLGALSTGIVKNTTATGVLSIAVAADFPTLNQNTTGTAAGLSATLVATSGGTGQSSYAVGDLLYASTTTALSKLADVATGNALISGGVGVAPSWGKIGLTTHVSGTLAATNGGTGIGAYATGDLLYANSPSSLARIASAPTGLSLISSGSGVAPAWGKIGLTTHVSGTLPVTNGGTGTATALTPGSVVFAGASGIYSENNANFFWDAANIALGLGTLTPTHILTTASYSQPNTTQSYANIKIRDLWGFASAPEPGIVFSGYTDGFTESALGSISVLKVNATSGDAASIIKFVVSTATPGTHVTAMQIASDGYAQCNGLQFPATQAASANANTLDDYEEGSWTPTIVGGTTAGAGTYTTQVGKYTKIGNSVTITGRVTWTAHTGTGGMRIGGLPFTSMNVANVFASVTFGYINNVVYTAANSPLGYVNTNSTQIILVQMPSGGGAIANVNMDTAGDYIFSCTYMV
jgi:hypothetical protein